MANQNRTAADALKDMENTPDGAPEQETLADEFVSKLAEGANGAQEPQADERPRRPRPPRDVKAFA